MNPATLSASAAQANTQGQQLYNSDLSNASNYQNNYNTNVAQSQAANQAVQQQSQYMQGAGSGANVYNQQLQGLQQQYAPNLQGQLSNANKSLFGLTGALNDASQQFNTPGGVGAYGLSAPALAGYEGAALAPLQTGVANANTQVNALNGQLGTLMTGANQATTSQVQTEQGSLTGLQDVYSNALAQQQSAQDQMQFFQTLAQQQGGLNAQQQQYYAQSIASLQNAQAALTQANAAANQANAQAALYQQTYGANAQAQAAAQAKTQAATQAKSNQEYQTMMTPATPSKSATKSGNGANPSGGAGPLLNSKSPFAL